MLREDEAHFSALAITQRMSTHWMPFASPSFSVDRSGTCFYSWLHVLMLTAHPQTKELRYDTC